MLRGEKENCLRYNLFNNASVYISKAEVTAVVTVGELLMVEAELVQDGGMEIVHVHLALHGVVTVFVGIAIGKTRLEASSSQTNGKAIRVMVASGAFILGIGSPAKFAAPPYDGVIE